MRGAAIKSALLHVFVAIVAWVGLPQLFDDAPIGERVIVVEMVDIADQRNLPSEIVEKAVEYFTANYDVIDVDGVRILFGDGWGLVRASNTQPVIVMRFEARTEARLAEIIRSRRTRRRSRSDIPPQIPNFSPFTSAYSRQSILTSHAPQIDLARRVEAPLSGKNRSASAPRQFA